jgi:competence protein ComEC
MQSINWQSIPFIRFVIPFTFGIWLNASVDKSLPFPILLLVAMTVVIAFLSRLELAAYRQWILGILINLSLFLLGWQIMFWNNPTHKTTHYQHVINKNEGNQKYWVSGKVINLPTTKNTTKVELALQTIGKTADSLEAVTGKLLCYIEADTFSKSLNYGDNILFQTFVNTVEPPKNPHQFDYKQFLKYKKIHFQAFVPAENWQNLNVKSSGLLSWINQLRIKRIAQIKTFVKGEAEQGVAMALLLGFKEELSDDIQAAYSETGAIHVLAVSGLHVGIIAMILRFILNQFYWKKRKWLKLVLIILPIWFYALFTGFTPSVIRATVMFTMLVYGLERNSQPNIYNILAASAFVLLLFEPYFLFSVGFQLSYAAVFGIVYFQPKLAIWYLPENKIINYFWQLTMVSVAATLGTLPLTLYYFHQFPIWFWLSSAIVIPAAFVILILGLAFFTFGLIPYLDVFFGKAIYWTIHIMNWCIQTIHHFPFAVIKGLWFTEVEFYLILAAILTFGFLLQTRKIRWTIYSLSFVILLASISLFHHFQATQQKQVVIYSISNASAIDFINGKTVTNLQSDNLKPSNYEFAAQSHHWQMNIETIDSVGIDENLNQPFLKKQANLIQFHDKTFLIINKNIAPTAEKIEVDYLIITNNPKIKIANLNNAFTFKKIIFDASNKFWQIENWKTECEDLDIDYQDIRGDYAFVLDF